MSGGGAAHREMSRPVATHRMASRPIYMCVMSMLQGEMAGKPCVRGCKPAFRHGGVCAEIGAGKSQAAAKLRRGPSLRCRALTGRADSVSARHCNWRALCHCAEGELSRAAAGHGGNAAGQMGQGLQDHWQLRVQRAIALGLVVQHEQHLIHSDAVCVQRGVGHSVPIEHA